MTTKLTVLGCGGSLGIPSVMNNFGECDSNNPKNFRTRTSAWVEHNGKNFLIDTSPDMRSQILAHGKAGIVPDAVLYTHAHADHCHGIDELRAYYWMDRTKPFAVHGHPDCMHEISQRFDYLFEGTAGNTLYQNAMLRAEAIIIGPNTIAGQTFEAIEMSHVPEEGMITLGYRFGDIAWCTDFKSIDARGMQQLAGVKVWFAAISDWKEPHPNHALLCEVIAMAEELGRPKTYLIHLNPGLDYVKLLTDTPDYMEPAYDGLVVAYP